MNADQFRDAANTAIEDVISYFKSLSELRVLPSIKPGYLRPLLPGSAPEDPQPTSSVFADIKQHILPGLTHWQSPRFMAFFPATVTYPSILGEIFSAAFNAPAFNWLCSPACSELETIVLDWVAEALGLPDCFFSTGSTGGGGVIQGSASEAIVTVMFAAREAAVTKVLESEGLIEHFGDAEDEIRTRKREDRAAEVRCRLVAICSDQSHSSSQKAANILGVRYRGIQTGRNIGFRLTGAALQAKLEECVRQGLQPFYVTATIGTTGTCAVDELGEIAEVKRRWEEKHGNPLWVHVDAAYGGAALLCEEFRAECRAEHLAGVDSFDMNLHKWLLVNFDASCLYVRDRRPLTTAMSITPAYLANPTQISGLVTDYRDWQIPLGRRFRALKIWFVLRTYGVRALRDMVRRHVALGDFFAGLVRTRPDAMEIVTGPAFALTTVRVVGAREPAGAGAGGGGGGARARSDSGGAAHRNRLTKEVCERINERGHFFLTGTVVDGVYVIRVVSANERAEEKYVRAVFEALLEARREIEEEAAAAATGDGNEGEMNVKVNGA